MTLAGLSLAYLRARPLATALNLLLLALLPFLLVVRKLAARRATGDAGELDPARP